MTSAMPEVSEPIAVNTGPLIALSAGGCLELLPQLHPRVVAPDAVLREFLRGPSTAPSDPRLRPQWLEVLPLAGAPSAALVTQLDAGEAAVITLAIEHSIDLVVIDERRARLLARALGLRVTGSVGILLRAKREGLVPAIRPCLDAMQARGVWLSERLRAAALIEAGEDA